MTTVSTTGRGTHERNNLSIVRLLVLWAVLSAAMTVAGGCADDGLRRLTEKDVTGLPPGDAVGTTYSGSFLPISLRVLDCHCQTAIDCDVFRSIAPGDAFPVVQQDGVLMIGADPACVGSVNRQGRFRCGASAQNVAGGIFFTLTEGWFGVRGGVPESMQIVSDLSSYMTNGLVTEWECDARTLETAVFVGP